MSEADLECVYIGKTARKCARLIIDAHQGGAAVEPVPARFDNQNGSALWSPSGSGATATGPCASTQARGPVRLLPDQQFRL
jgi:hypothetical protein